MGTSYNPKIVTDGLVLNLDPANVKSYPANQDPFVNNVSLMLAMDGANNSTTFTDSSQNALAVTAVGNTKISTDQSKFGGASAYFDGTGDYLSFTGGMPSGTGTAFTIECWIRLDAFSNYRSITRTAGGLDILVRPDGSITCDQTSVASIASSAAGVIIADTWYHVAVTRDTSNNYKLFVNGTQMGSGTNSFSVTAATTIGYSAAGPTVYFKGYIDDFRVTNALRYTANFTPPVAPLSLPGRLTDLTKNKLNTTLISGPTYSGGSLVFDGSTQYINIGSNSNLILGTNNFALELWFKPIARLQSYPFLLHNQVGGGGFTTNCWQINDRHANNPTLVTFWNYNYNAGSSAMLASTSIANGNWYHLVITRIGNLFSMYLNSILQSTVTSSISMDNGVATNYGFNTTGGGGFNGNASSIKIYNNKGLTAAEVFQNYNATKGRFR